jgi:hypothetical protein
MQRRGRGEARDHLDPTDKGAEEIERMDRLGQQDAAAVAREAAASRLVVVALGTPPLHPAIAGDQRGPARRRR